MSGDARPDHNLVRCPKCGAWTWGPDRLCLRCGWEFNRGTAD